MRQILNGVPKQPDIPSRKLSWWGRVRLGYQAYRMARRLPYKLVTGTEVLCDGGVGPSALEDLMTVWVTFINENGEEAKRQINLFS